MANTGFTVNGIDVSVNTPFISRSYLLDRYPELANTFKTAGLWVWGRNDYGQLGDNSTANKSSPVQTIAGGENWKQISGSTGSGAIKTDGTFWSWGGSSSSGNGIVPDNAYGQKSSPVIISSGATNWKQISQGYYTGSGIKTDGSLWKWGNGSQGQGGNGVIQIDAIPNQVGSSTNWKQTSSGGLFIAAIKTDGTLWLWGKNAFGQLGDNTSTNKSSPVQTISTGTNWKQVSAGFETTVAIKTDGTLWAWGSGDSGALGDNNTVNRSSPVQTIAGGTNWKQVSAGGYYCGAIKTDGTLWTWGRNGQGQLGTNDTTPYSSPVQTVSGGTNWKQISSGQWYANMGAIKTDGTLWMWGYNTYGQLGTGNITDRSSPVQTVAGGNNWKDIALGVSMVIAIRDDSADFGIGTL